VHVLQMSDNGQGADCNKAIIIITDELPETYEQVFFKYNWPDKQVGTKSVIKQCYVSDARSSFAIGHASGFYSRLIL